MNFQINFSENESIIEKFKLQTLCSHDNKDLLVEIVGNQHSSFSLKCQINATVKDVDGKIKCQIEGNTADGVIHGQIHFAEQRHF